MKIDKKKVAVLERVVNRQIAPYEVEAGEYYDSILFLGNASGGIKKRYAGLQEGEGGMKVVGLESVKRDYCNLSRRTQRWALEAILRGSTAQDNRNMNPTL